MASVAEQDMVGPHAIEDIAQLEANGRYLGKSKDCFLDEASFVLLDAQITGAPDATRPPTGQHGRFDQVEWLSVNCPPNQT